MINKKLFTKIRKEYSEYSKGRGKIINRSNTILRLAKQAIFSLHRGDVKKADEILKEVEAGFKDIDVNIIKKNTKMQNEGALRAAYEEYAEARLFYNFITKNEITDVKELTLSPEAYIGGLSDVTGEIVRYAVQKATEKDLKGVDFCYETVEAVYGELLEMDIIGSLRQKFDQTKNNLRKLEQIRYELKLRSDK